MTNITNAKSGKQKEYGGTLGNNIYIYLLTSLWFSEITNPCYDYVIDQKWHLHTGLIIIWKIITVKDGWKVH